MKRDNQKEGSWGELGRNLEDSRELAEARFTADEDLQAKGLNCFNDILNPKCKNMQMLSINQV